MEHETEDTWIRLAAATRDVVTWIALIASTRRLDAASQTAAEETEGCLAHDDVQPVSNETARLPR